MFHYPTITPGAPSWSKAYAYDGSSWNVDKPVALTCNGTKVNVADVTPTDLLPDYWCNGTLTGSLPTNSSFFAALTDRPVLCSELLSCVLHRLRVSSLT